MSSKTLQQKKPTTSKKPQQQTDTQMSLDKTIQSFWAKYSAQTHPRVKLIDWFILFLVTIMSIQFFYRMVVGDDFPKNAFLAGMFCPVGVIVLLLEMRKSGEKTNFRKLGQFFVAALVLFVVSINFVG